MSENKNESTTEVIEAKVEKIAEVKPKTTLGPIVEVRPIDKPTWHGKKGKESFSQPKTIQALYNHTTGKYDTGLSEKDVEILNKKLPGIDLSDVFIPEKEHPFWSSKAAQIKLENNRMYFDMSKPMDYIKVKMMRASKFVANSWKEYEEGKWDEATHVILDETEEVTQKAGKIQLRKKAILLAAKMSVEEKAALVMILSETSVKGRSPDFIEVKLDEIIEDKAEEFINYAELDTKKVRLRATILEAIQAQALTKENSAIFYMGERIGFDINDAIEWFEHPDNQKIKVSILNKLNGTK